MIGIVGGVGPHAGLDLMRKVFDQSLAANDQEHVDALLFSLPSSIVDRTEYLLGRVKENPGRAMAGILLRLEQAGATVAAIPCNTAHAAPIWDLIGKILQVRKSRIRLLHMIGETLSLMESRYPDLRRIGILATTGTSRSGLYQQALIDKSYDPLLPPDDMQHELIHPAIYDPEYGIKSLSGRVHPRAMASLREGFSSLAGQGAEAVILGCTEIPLAFPAPAEQGMICIDPAVALARALLRESHPDKLKPLK